MKKKIPTLDGKPKNDWAKAMYVAIKAKTFSMADVLLIYDRTFYKLQSRLGEIEKAHPTLSIERKNIDYVNKITDQKKHYTQYTLLSPYTYAVNLYNFLNKNGLNKK